MSVLIHQAPQLSGSGLEGVVDRVSSETTHGMTVREATRARGVPSQSDFLAIEQQQSLAGADPGGDREAAAQSRVMMESHTTSKRQNAPIRAFSSPTHWEISPEALP